MKPHAHPLLPFPDLSVATEKHLPYVVDLQNKHRRQLGFLSTGALSQYLARRQIIIAHENNDPCGYLLFGGYHHDRPRSDPDTLKIIQACIQFDARRIRHATALVNHAIDHALARGIQSIGLWCASDLEANQFWAACGFQSDGTRKGGNRTVRNRTHIHWRLDLPVPVRQLYLWPSHDQPNA